MHLNITSGFSALGVYPVNPNIFTESDFAPAFTTDRPQPESLSSIANVDETSKVAGPDIEAVSTHTLDSTGTPDEQQPSTSKFSPEFVRPFPKAPPRVVQSKRGKKRRKTAILTDTPEKEALENEEKLRNERKKKTSTNIGKPKQMKKLTSCKKGPEVRQIFPDDSSDDEPLINIVKKKTLARNHPKKDDWEISSEDDDTFCLVCDKIYQEEKEKEDWLQCTKCKMWAHDHCAKSDPFYICINCMSEYSDEPE